MFKSAKKNKTPEFKESEPRADIVADQSACPSPLAGGDQEAANDEKVVAAPFCGDEVAANQSQSAVSRPNSAPLDLFAPRSSLVAARDNKQMCTWVGVAACLAFTVGAFYIVNLRPASLLSGVSYSIDYKGYQVQAERATARGSFDTADEAYRLAIDSAKAQKAPPVTIGKLCIKAGDAASMRPDADGKRPPGGQDGTIGPDPFQRTTFEQCKPLASHYFSEAAKSFAAARDKEREFEALTRLSKVMDARDKADLRQLYERLIELGKGSDFLHNKIFLIEAYNQMARIELANGNVGAAKQYLENAFLLDQVNVGLQGPYAQEAADTDSLLAIYKRAHDYNNIVRILSGRIRRSSNWDNSSMDTIKLQLAHAYRKLGNAKEAERLEQAVKAARERNDVNFPPTMGPIYDDTEATNF